MSLDFFLEKEGFKDRTTQSLFFLSRLSRTLTNQSLTFTPYNAYKPFVVVLFSDAVVARPDSLSRWPTRNASNFVLFYAGCRDG